MNGASKCARAIDHAERAAGEEDEEDDGSRIGHSLGYGDQHLKRTNGTRRHGVIGAGHNHVPFRGGILAAVVFARGKHVTESCCDNDARNEQDERVRYSQMGHGGTLSCRNSGLGTRNSQLGIRGSLDQLPIAQRRGCRSLGVGLALDVGSWEFRSH